ncbi:MAG: DUF2344 domain-containing protein [Clostridia bacterium]|nr:DUF2344 domain-containing protein [Clostridia bacterium]
MVYTKLRVKFERVGTLRFISHLDLCRAIRTIFRRAKLPIRYSEGFNPHPRMTFTLPLPLGAESECEYMDIFLPEGYDLSTVCPDMNAVSPVGLRFLEAYLPESSLSDVMYSRYDLHLFGITAAEAQAILDNPPALKKKNKKGVEKVVDIAPMIHDGVAEDADGGAFVTVTLDAGDASYLNPDRFASVFGAEDYRLRRTALYFADGREFR